MPMQFNSSNDLTYIVHDFICYFEKLACILFLSQKDTYMKVIHWTFFTRNRRNEY